jgi:NitT/TauT family transport system ATP-binding protein
MYVEIEAVRKSFQAPGGRRLLALDGVSLGFERGAFVSIVGPSGCGKSTLLRLIDGLQRPDEGEVRIDGKPVEGPGPDRAMVFQQHNLFPWRKVLTNVEFGLEMLGVKRPERRQRATRLLETVGLGEFADYYPSQLSGGMQQRVGLARALVLEPEILLMDEPFAAVDALTRVTLQTELRRIWLNAGLNVVFVTHDIEEALFLADRVIVMSARPGAIAEDITLDFPRERDQSLRASQEFGDLKLHCWERLQHGARAGRAATASKPLPLPPEPGRSPLGAGGERASADR